MIKNQDRRYDSRMKVNPNSGWQVMFAMETDTIACEILDVSKDGLRIGYVGELSATRIDRLQSQTSAYLLKDGQQEHQINLTILKAVFAQDRLEWVLQCSLADDESKAYIWHLIYDTRNARPTAATQGTSGPRSEASRIPGRGIYTEEARLQRLEFIEAKVGARFEFVRDSRLNASRLAGNIENHIGGVEIPVGLAGPLLFNGKNATGEIYAPVATSEGALVASASRGALLLSESGGVTTRTIGQRMIRVPMFAMDSLDGAIFFSDWLKHHVPELQAAVAKVSHHANLIGVDITLSGRVIHASFVYATGDAAGQNMTTAATWHACQWALAQAKHLKGVIVENFSIDSGLSGDKKVNFRSFLEGRGTRVIAEAFIPAAVLVKVLKVSVDKLLAYHNFGMTALAQAGAIGSNINVANTIAAIFTATGQDIACVHESSLATFQLEKMENGIYAAMHLPSLIVGTVGGGSALPAQAECLKIMGCQGENKVARFAEVIAGYCLALDLSTASALAGGTFVKAHERLGRNHPVQWFKRSDLDAGFFTRVMRSFANDESLTVHKVEIAADIDATDSIITELTARNQEKLLGHFPYRITWTDRRQKQQQADVVVKSKPIDQEVILLAGKMAGMCNMALGDLYERFKLRNESFQCHVKEIAVYSQKDPRFTRNAPKVYGVFQDEKREVFIVIMERLENMMLMGEVDNPSAWQKSYIEAAIRGMAELHSIWYGREEELKAQKWIGYIPTSKALGEQKHLFREMIRHGSVEFPALVNQEILLSRYTLIDSIDSWWAEIEAMKKTLIHNDFNPRNIALRMAAEGPALCAFDWELATMHIPQHDLAELLSFVTTADTPIEEIDGYIELHRRTLADLAQVSIPSGDWRRGYELALWDIALGRIAMYVMAHTFKHYSFMEHLFKNNQRLIAMAKAKS